MLGSTVRRRLLARLGLPLPRLDAVLSHGRGSVYLQRKISEAMLRIIINQPSALIIPEAKSCSIRVVTPWSLK